MIDAHTPDISQNGNRSVFILLRQTIRLRGFLRRSAQNVDRVHVSKAIKTIVETVNAFEASHGEWMKQCTVNFASLSSRSKTFAGVYILDFPSDLEANVLRFHSILYYILEYGHPSCC